MNTRTTQSILRSSSHECTATSTAAMMVTAVMVMMVGVSRPPSACCSPPCPHRCRSPRSPPPGGRLTEIGTPQLSNLELLPGLAEQAPVPGSAGRLHVCVLLKHGLVLAIVLLLQSGLNALEAVVECAGARTTAGKVLKRDVLEPQIALQ